MLLLFFAVACGLIAIFVVWLTARKLATPVDGAAHSKFVGSLAGYAALPPGLLAFYFAMKTGHTTFMIALMIFMIIGATIASVHGEHVGARRANKHA